MDITAAVSHTTLACLLLLCCLSVHHFYTGCDAASTALPQNLTCSTAGNYTPADPYAANLNQLLAALPDTVRKNGGFFNGTAGQPGAAGTAYVLALCFISDLSRPDCHDCHDCLAAATSNSGGLVDRCPGSTTVVATYDRCLVHYSDAGFFGTPYTDAMYKWVHPGPITNKIYARILERIALLNQFAANKPARSGYISSSSPYMLVQCTWDLPPDKCKACLDMLRSKIPRSPAAESKTPSCRLSYSIDSFAIAARSSSTDANSSTPSKNDKGAGSPSRSLSTGAVVGTVISVIVAVPTFVACLVCCLRKRRRHHRRLVVNETRSLAMTREGTQTAEFSVQEATQVHTGRQFSYRELFEAAENFSRTPLGRGYFGEVFKGVLGNDDVAIKRILIVDDQARRNFTNEINNISQLSHPNLVPLIGWCDENDELLLVYELIPNGSLDQHLHEKEAPLQWDMRYEIAIGIAEALNHLHEHNCIHRDIKPSNVMLDDHFNAKLGDFGLVRRMRPGNTSETMTITGDLGYIDPKTIRSGKAGKSSDIYSFGVLLLEIACGRRPTLRQEDPNVNTVIQKARMSYARGALLDAVDERLDGNFVTAQVQLVIRVGLLCVQDLNTRPKCRQVLNYLSGTFPPPAPRKDQDSLAIQVHDTSDPKEYSYDQLSEATNHFSHTIGVGGFAEVFEGQLDKIPVAVKRMFRVDDITVKEFLLEIKIIRQLRHRNLLPLVGWYANKSKLLIVYKLMRNGSLRGHLHQKPNTLQWNQRFKIISGIASAVAYLHEGSNLQTVLHRDIKPSNIMLDEEYNARLGDFGLVREIDDDVSKKTATFGGTINYMDPEYFRTLKASKQTDVYSFGVVALEMVLGETPKAVVSSEEEGQITNTFVQDALRWYKDKAIFDKVDKRLNGNFDEDQMRRVIRAGIMCVDPDRKKRPSCTRVKYCLERHASEFEPSPSSSMFPHDSSDIHIT